MIEWIALRVAQLTWVVIAAAWLVYVMPGRSALVGEMSVKPRTYPACVTDSARQHQPGASAICPTPLALLRERPAGAGCSLQSGVDRPSLDSGKVQLIWVSAETLRVATRVAETIPPDTLFTEVERPPLGVRRVRNARRRVDAETGGTVVVDAIIVGSVRLRAVPALTTWGSAATRSAATSAVGIRTPGRRDARRPAPTDGPTGWLMIRSTWCPVWTTRTAAASMVEDRRLLVALWTLMDRSGTRPGHFPAQQEGTAPVRRHPAHCHRRPHPG